MRLDTLLELSSKEETISSFCPVYSHFDRRFNYAFKENPKDNTFHLEDSFQVDIGMSGESRAAITLYVTRKVVCDWITTNIRYDWETQYGGQFHFSSEADTDAITEEDMRKILIGQKGILLDRGILAIARYESAAFKAMFGIDFDAQLNWTFQTRPIDIRMDV